MDAPRHQSFPFNLITSDDRWREEAPLGRAIRAYRYDEHHVVRKRPSHEVSADRLFVNSEGSMKLSAAAARPPVDGAAPKDAHREVRQMIDVYPDVTTRIKQDLGSGFAWHCYIKPIKQRETPLAIVNLGHRIPFAVPVEAFFTFPAEQMRPILSRALDITLVGYQNGISQCTSLPQGHRVQGRRHQMAPLEHPSPPAELAFPDARLVFLFHPWHNLEIDGSRKKAPIPNHNCHEQAITAI